MAAATATAQTGATVMRNGRIVSLAECESRSNAMKTMTVPISRRTKPTITAGHLSDFTLADQDYFDTSDGRQTGDPGR